MVAPRFDELIHPSTRLSIVALLASADWIEFSYVRDRLGLSDSALSKQFATLEAAGSVVLDRPSTGRVRGVSRGLHRRRSVGASTAMSPPLREVARQRHLGVCGRSSGD